MNEKKPRTPNKNVIDYLQKKLGYYAIYDYPCSNEQVIKSKEEILEMLLQNNGLCPLRGEEAEKELISQIYDHSFLTTGTNTTQEYINKVSSRTLSEKEYTKIMKQIEQEGSILPTSSKRTFNYGGGEGDVILSTTTGKMYCVDSYKDLSELLSDYKGNHFYSSRSGASGAGYILAGKKSLIYLPTSRIDVSDPLAYNCNPSKINGMQITARANRGYVDKDYPVTITYGEGEHEYAFIDPNNVGEIISIIKSGGKLPENFTSHVAHICDYFDENGEQQSLDISYISDKQWPRKTITNIAQWTGKIPELQNELTTDGSEFDRVIGIYKSGDNFVERGYLGLATKFYGREHPLEKKGEALFEYEIGTGGRLTKEFYDTGIEQVRGWKFLSNTAAYKLDKNTGNYIVMVDYNFSNLSLSDNSEALLKFFPMDRVGGRGDTTVESEGLVYTATSNNGSVIFVAKDIKESGIEAVADALSKDTKQKAQDIYEKNLREAFRGTLNNAKSEKIYLEGRESYKNMIYTCFGDKVYLGYIIKNTELNSKFASIEPLQDYEKVISKDERENRGIKYRNDYMRKKAYNKSIKEYINFYRWSSEKQIDEVKRYLKNNLEEKFFIDDSLEVGNCLPGTEGFMQDYQLQEGITGEELLKHKKFESMIGNSRFRNVVLNKVSIEID